MTLLDLPPGQEESSESHYSPDFYSIILTQNQHSRVVIQFYNNDRKLPQVLCSSTFIDLED